MFPAVPFIFHTLAETRRVRARRRGVAAAVHLRRRSARAGDVRPVPRPLRHTRSASSTGAARRARSRSTSTPIRRAAGTRSAGRCAGIDVVVVDDDGVRHDRPARRGEIEFRSPALTAGYVGADAGGQRAVPRRMVPHRRPRARRRRREPVRHRPHQAVHLDERLQGRPVRGRGGAASPAGCRRRRRRRRQGRPWRGDRQGGRGPRPRRPPTSRVCANSWSRRAGEQLAPFKVPRIVEFRDEIPRSPLGKILRKYLV